MTDDRYRGSLREAFHNWRWSTEPLPRKVRMLVRNEWRKLRTLKSCCGHIDEVGC